MVIGAVKMCASDSYQTLTEEQSERFCCHFSGEIMDDPVIDPTTLNDAGLCYANETDEIKKAAMDCGNYNDVSRFESVWLERAVANTKNGTSPITRKEIQQSFIHDETLKAEIESFVATLLPQQNDQAREAPHATRNRLHLFIAQRGLNVREKIRDSIGSIDSPEFIALLNSLQVENDDMQFDGFVLSIPESAVTNMTRFKSTLSDLSQTGRTFPIKIADGRIYIHMQKQRDASHERFNRHR